MAPPMKRCKLDPLRRQKPVEELTFSIDARQEYLTGFSKRKQARKEQAKEHAIKLAKEEKIKERKELREQRKVDLETHVAEVNKVLKEQNALANGKDPGDVDSDASDEFAGFQDPSTDIIEPPPTADLPDDAEYVDEDKYTTVTVEPMCEDASSSDDEDADPDTKSAESAKAPEPEAKKKKRPWEKDGGGTKKKKQKFRYESKAERSLTRQKQKSKNSRAARERKDSKASGGGAGGRKKK